MQEQVQVRWGVGERGWGAEVPCQEGVTVVLQIQHIQK
jgi:hypothetical protein